MEMGKHRIVNLVEKFCKENFNWEYILSNPPYNLKISRDNGYVMFKYNQLSSDLSNPIVQDARGLILFEETLDTVCWAFSKFFNYSEINCAEIDWNSAAVEEKIDGSLLKIWHHNNHWHVSTNGIIDAYKAEVSDNDWTFGKLFDAAIKNMAVPDFFNGLDQHMTYMFELVSPRSKVTIYYPETRLYYLGCRDMTTMQECKVYYSVMREADILYPKVYPLHNLEDCLAYVKTMTKDEEGFVVKDKNFNRIKIKSPEYLMAFHMNNNGVVTTRRIINMIKDNYIDDFMAYCPEYKDSVQEVFNGISNLAKSLEDTWARCKDTAAANRQVFSCVIKNLPYQDFLWKRYDNPDYNTLDYIMSKPDKKIKEMIKGE